MRKGIRKRRVLKGCVASLAVAFSTGIQADESIATLSNITGTVLINQGGIYRGARPGHTLALRVGDRVFTLKGSSADVVYPDTCVLHLTAKATLTLGNPDECALKTAQVRTAQPLESGGGASADIPDDDGSNWVHAAVFGAAAAATITAATDSFGDDPVSPE